MKSTIVMCILCLPIAVPTWATHASNSLAGQPHDRAYEAPGHQLIGEPADQTSVTRTIELTINETSSGYMLFDPDAIQIKTGSVVRFAINNPGELNHEFFLGSFDEVEKHQIWMRKHPDMKHGDENSVMIPSGETTELVWQFSTSTNMQFVCLLPGHHEAGMWGVIIVHDHLAPKQKN